MFTLHNVHALHIRGAHIGGRRPVLRNNFIEGPVLGEHYRCARMTYGVFWQAVGLYSHHRVKSRLASQHYAMSLHYTIQDIILNFEAALSPLFK